MHCGGVAHRAADAIVRPRFELRLTPHAIGQQLHGAPLLAEAEGFGGGAPCAVDERTVQPLAALGSASPAMKRWLREDQAGNLCRCAQCHRKRQQRAVRGADQMRRRGVQRALQSEQVVNVITDAVSEAGAPNLSVSVRVVEPAAVGDDPVLR